MSKRAKDLVAEAAAAVRSIDVEAARGLLNDPGAVFVDVREPAELEQTGRIPGAVHAVRGLLEFLADPESPMHNPKLDRGKRLVVTCASGGRSMLAARTLMEMGYPEVLNLTGGMTAWRQAGAPVER